MKKNLKFISITALSVMTVVGLASCGGGPKYTEYSGVLAVSGPAAQSEWLEDTLAAYNAERVEAGFSAIQFDVREIEESAADSAVADWSTGPDVYAFASDKIANLNASGALAEVRGNYKKFITSTMSKAALEAGTFAGKTLAYPYAGDNGYFLMYDSSRLDAEDVLSWDNLFAAAAEAEEKVEYPLETSFFSAGALFTYGARFNATYSRTGALEEVTADFNTNKGLKAGKAIYNIVKNESWSNAELAPTEANGVIAAVNGSWKVADYKKAIEDAGGTFACAPIPTMTIDGDTKNMGSFLGYKLYGVNPQVSQGDSQRLAAAHEVAMYLAGEQVQQSRFDTFSVAPTNKVVAASDEVQNTPHIKAIAEQAKYSVAQTAVPAGVWTAPNVFVLAIESGQCTLDNMTSYLETLNNTIINSEG